MKHWKPIRVGLAALALSFALGGCDSDERQEEARTAAQSDPRLDPEAFSAELPDDPEAADPFGPTDFSNGESTPVGFGDGGNCYPGHKDYPECKKPPSGPSLPPPSCSGKSTCYCYCRVENQCWNDPSTCDELSACLTSCDQQYPSSCPYPGSSQPESYRECYIR